MIPTTLYSVEQWKVDANGVGKVLCYGLVLSWLCISIYALVSLHSNEKIFLSPASVVITYFMRLCLLVSNESEENINLVYIIYCLQGSKPSCRKSNIVVTSSPSEMPVSQTPPVSLIAFSSGYRNKVDYDACQLGSVFVSTASPFVASPIIRSQTTTLIGDGGDAENDPLLQGSIDSTENRQVRGCTCL